jgi:hypothetical protein
MMTTMGQSTTRVLILVSFLLASNSVSIANAFFVRSTSFSTRMISRSRPTSFGILIEEELSLGRASIISSSFPSPTTLLLPLRQSKKGREPETKEDDDKKKKKTPAAGNWFVLPLVAVVGVDLLLNILVLTKRTFEALILGQAPSTETWW